MPNHVGKYVVFYRGTVVGLVMSLLAMASSIATKRFIFAVSECRWLNNTIKHFKQWRIYYVVEAVYVQGREIMSILASSPTCRGICTQTGYQPMSAQLNTANMNIA